mmetsp:Transcript_17024/g.50806  ORF Transcript_17024/g.50806 Transcript_17024/m.50806 type:complete len:221 (-) Transcript_17024:202-864(-)
MHVGVSLLGVDATVCDDVVQPTSKVTALASRVLEGWCVVAVDELLFRQGHDLAGVHGIDALGDGGGGKSPAAPTGGIVGVLVLDGAHNALGAPVYLVHQLILGIHVAADANLLGSPEQRIGCSPLAQVGSAEFIIGPVRKTVQAQLHGAVGIGALISTHPHHGLQKLAVTLCLLHRVIEVCAAVSRCPLLEGFHRLHLSGVKPELRYSRTALCYTRSACC